MKHRILYSALALGSLSLALFFAFQGSAEVIAGARGPAQVGGFDRTISDSNERLINDGRQIFRFDTFGDEAFWTDTARLNEVVLVWQVSHAALVGMCELGLATMSPNCPPWQAAQPLTIPA